MKLNVTKKRLETLGGTWAQVTELMNSAGPLLHIQFHENNSLAQVQNEDGTWMEETLALQKKQREAEDENDRLKGLCAT